MGIAGDCFGLISEDHVSGALSNDSLSLEEDGGNDMVSSDDTADTY